MANNQKQDTQQIMKQQMLHGVKVGKATVLMTNEELKNYEKQLEKAKPSK